MATIDISKDRDSRTQAVINSVAERFLRNPAGDEKAWLRSLLGVTPKFTFSEAKILASRLGVEGIARFMPIAATGVWIAKWPVMYNWALTLDSIMNNLRTLFAMVALLESNISLGNTDIAYLQSLIFHPSFRPWVNVIADPSNPMTPNQKFRQSLITPGVGNNQYLRAASAANKERNLILSLIVGMLVGLSQGNYKTYFSINGFNPNPLWIWKHGYHQIVVGGVGAHIPTAFRSVGALSAEAARRQRNVRNNELRPAVVDALVTDLQRTSPSSAALASAIKASGVTGIINKYYRDLQVEFARVWTNSGLAQPDPYGPDFGRNQISGPMIGNALKCGKGMMPVYLDSNSEIVAPRNVFVTINGRKYLSYAVDPTKSYCTQMVGAFGASVARKRKPTTKTTKRKVYAKRTRRVLF